MTWTSAPLLAAIAQASDCITDARLAEITGLSAIQVERAAGKLRKHGFIDRNGDGDCYTLTVAGHEAHRAGQKLTSGPGRGKRQPGYRGIDPGLRQRAWNAMRLGRKVTISDLLLLCAEGGERDPRSNLLKYLQALARAGYVRRLPLRGNPYSPSSNGEIRWYLITDTGPQAPVNRPQRGSLYDPNLERDIPLTGTPARIPAHGSEARP